MRNSLRVFIYCIIVVLLSDTGIYGQENSEEKAGEAQASAKEEQVSSKSNNDEKTAELEEMVVTASRRETLLKETPDIVQVTGIKDVRSVFDREAWNWKPDPSTPTSPDGLTTPLENYTKLDAGVDVTFRKEYKAFIKVNNILGEDIENLDDVYTVIDGEPVWTFGLVWNIRF